MSGFGSIARVKQFGAILRGLGPPVPQAGVVGDLYIDGQTFQLFNKRFGAAGPDPWGRYLFVVPPTYQIALKWFTASAPAKDLGVNGDYCLLWGGYPNYGLQPSIFGPKAAGAWPGSATPVAVTLNPLYTGEDVHGI
jgi:hypothetical protein